MTEELVESLDDRVITHLANDRFHRVLWLPPKPSAGRPSKLRITYSDLGSQAPRSSTGTPPPVILYCGGMMSSRYAMAMMDQYAEEYGIRLLCTDRPGMGGSEPIALKFRMETWLDTVRLLLSHLGIPYVSIVAHSCGAIYALNLLLHARDLLHPQTPRLALFAPWVHPSRSKKHLLTAASLLPARVLDQWPVLALAINNTILPALSFSKGTLQTSWSILRHSKDVADEPDPNVQFLGALRQKAFDYTVAEGVGGAAEECKVCLKVDVPAEGSGTSYWGWGGWEEYDVLVRVLVERERARGRGSKLRVEVLFAEDDALIGRQGGEWFDKCWKQEMCTEDVVQYSSRVVPGTDHDSITNAEVDAVQDIVKSMADEDT